MGAAASLAVPEQIRFTDLLSLAPLLTQHTPGHTINVTALQLLFKRNRNTEGFVSREKFIELVVQFGESAELRKTILHRSADYVAPDLIVEKVLPPLDEIYRFRDDPRYKDVRFIDFDSFRAHGSYPCFTDRAHISKDGHVQLTLTTPACEINYESSFIIFVSHTWCQRTATLVHKLDNKNQTELHHLHIAKDDGHINTHPDTEFNEQYKVCLSGLTKFIHTHCKNFDKVYLWVDYSCLDLTPPHIEHTLNSISLSTIMNACDCVFTPLVDGDVNWEFPAELEHFYEDFNPSPWNHGPGAYMNRSWCRIEMFFGSNVPLLGDLSPERIGEFHAQHEFAFKAKHGLLPVEGEEVKEVVEAPVAAVIPLHMVEDKPTPEVVYVHTAPHRPAYYSRRSRMSQRMRTRALSEQRPHVIYGSYEYRLGLPPMIVSPISNLYIEKYAPLAAFCSRSDDISIYKPVDSSSNVLSVNNAAGNTNSVSFSGMDNRGVNDSRNSSSNTLSSLNTSPHPTLSSQNVYKSSVNLDKNYSRAVITSPTDAAHKTHTASGNTTPLPQKRSTPAVLIRLNEEVQVLITKGKVGYDGEVNEDGERHGRGIYAYANGEKYVGEWEHGRREGKGYFQHMNGDIYQGEFHQDHECGVCNIRYACGDVYFGELHHRQRHGHGLLQYGCGDVYEGEFKRNCRHGEGVMRYSNGEVYAGMYLNDMRHGMGVLSDKQGVVLYHGYWQYDAQAPDYFPPEYSGELHADDAHADTLHGAHQSSDSLHSLEEHEHKHRHKHRHHHHSSHSRSEDSVQSVHTPHSHSSHHSPHHHSKHRHHHSHSRSHDSHNNSAEHVIHNVHSAQSPEMSRVFSDDAGDGAHSTLTSTVDSAAHTVTNTTNTAGCINTDSSIDAATSGTVKSDLKEQIKQMHRMHSSAKLLTFAEITQEHHDDLKTKPKKKKKVHTPSTVHHSTPSSVRGSGGDSSGNASGSANTPHLYTVTENATPHNTPHSNYSTPKVHTPASAHK